MATAMRCSCISLSACVSRSTIRPRAITAVVSMPSLRISSFRGCRISQNSAVRQTASPMGVRTISAAATASSFFELSAKDIDGKDKKLSAFKNKVVLVVNVASECGFTPQYKGLSELQNKYKSLEVLAFPCNQFGSQEPGDSKSIKAFAAAKGFKGPLFAKVDVNGSNADPVFNFLKEKKGGFLTKDIKWNFSKFLVGKDGEVLNRYGSTTTPEDIEADIKKALDA